MVHRPKYDDWSFPKGKVDAGESDEDAALREVEEETGFACELVREVSSTRYRDRSDRMKVVRYWVMRPIAGAFHPTREVDELRWLTSAEAAGVLSYEHDRELLSEVEP